VRAALYAARRTIEVRDMPVPAPGPNGCGVGPGSRVLVTGAGPIGNLATQVAAAVSATTVAVLDANADRLRRAVQVGATATPETLDALSAGDFDVVLECTGNELVTQGAIKALRPAGTAVLVGMGPALDVRLPVATIQARELTVVGTFRYANTYPAAIALAESGRVGLDGLVETRFPLREAGSALRANRENPALLKVMVDVREED
jgi:L-iditol 2-dehydrogenase